MCAAVYEIEANPGGDRVVMKPLAYGGVFGWLHLPRSSSADTGVVLVPALGRDERCGRAPMRLLADQWTAAGFPTLRYDHRGEGDSLCLDDPEGNAVEVWLDGVRAAITELRARTGVRRVVIGGLRVGASLAALMAEDADGLILLAPVLDGRSWVKRMRFLAGRQDSAYDKAIEFSGLYLSPATVEGLSRVDLAGARPPSCPIFLAAQNKLVEAYGAGLVSAGAKATVSGFPGFDALFMDAHSNSAPLDVFAMATAWLKLHFSTPRLSDPIAVRPWSPAELHHADGTERAVQFGPGLRGVVCTPAAPVKEDVAVLFCNTGGDPRSGIGGFATQAARALAAQGVASLRFDFQGLGDSPATAELKANHVYETPREADLDAAVTLMAARGYRRIAVVGICAGAYHAVRYAVLDPRVCDVFAISPVKLVWREGDSLAFGRRDDGKSAASYKAALRDPQTWRRLLSGRIDVATIVRSTITRIKRRLQALGDRLHGASPLEGLKRLSARGGRVHFLMGLEDISLDEIETWFGPRGARLKGLAGMTIAVDPQLDHGLARRKSREIALSALLDWMRAR